MTRQAIGRTEPERWLPRVTVATIVERDERFLMVKEAPNGNIVFNQPAGHLEANETLIQAAVRETLEETGWQVDVTGFLGLYRYDAPNGVTYLRHTFVAAPLQHHPERELDEGIIEACWLTQQELTTQKNAMRSPLVLQNIEHYLSGLIYPLTLFQDQPPHKG